MSLVPPNFSSIISQNVKVAIDYVSPYVTLPSMVFMGIIGMFVTVGLFFLYKKYGHRIKILEKFTQSQEGLEQKSAEIIMFYADWCPHCKTAMPEWDKIASTYQSTQINGHNVTFTKINCADESLSASNAKLISENKVEGYPTIKLFKGSEVFDFDAKPTNDSLLQFLQTVL